jgi:hypothetical protein
MSTHIHEGDTVTVRRGEETFRVKVIALMPDGKTFEGKRQDSLFADEIPFLLSDVVLPGAYPNNPTAVAPYSYDGCMDGTPGHEISLEELVEEDRRRLLSTQEALP